MAEYAKNFRLGNKNQFIQQENTDYLLARQAEQSSQRGHLVTSPDN